MSYAKKRKNLIEEPCTLVYTLNNTDILCFDDFSLIIRGLHSYMVEDIKEFKAKNTIHVRLGYQASVENATRKMANLCKYVTITKMSNFVKEDEISKLEELKRKFNIVGTTSCNATEEYGEHSRVWPNQQSRRYKEMPQPPKEI